MLQLERQKLILEYLKQNRKATTNELSEMLGVSTTTIRTDLNQMDKEKLLTKTHGGALYHDNSADNKELTGKAYFFHERALENKKEKEAIAANAIHMVKDHMCIFLDASSTAYTLGMKLTGFTELTVITNGIDLACPARDEKSDDPPARVVAFSFAHSRPQGGRVQAAKALLYKMTCRNCFSLSRPKKFV